MTSAIILMLGLMARAGAAVIPADSKYVRSLDGTWRFKLEQPGADGSQPRKLGQRDPITTPATFEPFYMLDYTEDRKWNDLPVPSNWEMVGFSPATYCEPDNASGFYRKWFEVPASWKGRRVLVNFDGVQNGAEIWLNGRPVNVSEPSWGRMNYHESGWTAWQADLTPAVRFGEKNLLALRVTKNTVSCDLDTGDYFFLGGIHRAVTLFSVPEMHVEDLTVTTPLLPGGQAEVRAQVKVSGGQPAVVMQLEGFQPVQAKVNGDRIAQLIQAVDDPRLWSAEHPNLYRLTVEMKDAQGQTTESISRKVGIRQITIEDGIFKVNGQPVKLAGICRHDIYPTKGSAVDEEVWKKDLTLMKESNINAVRTSHYPYGSRFYDLCDEMGFYVVDELPYCACPTDTKELTPAFLQRARETIARDKNHPCVVIWAIGNENRPGINQKIVADKVKELDPTRPRLNSWLDAKENGVEFNDRHYTSYGDMEKQAIASAKNNLPMIYLENPNVWDVRNGADYGCLDAWGRVLGRCWDVTWKHDNIPGIFPFEWQDRAVCDKFPQKPYEYDPATGVQYVKTKGLVDGWRTPRPDLYQVKMVYSPIVIAREADLTSKPGYAVLSATNRYSFTNLSEIDAEWVLLRNGAAVKKGAAHFDLAPMATGKIELPIPAGVSADVLRIAFDHPGGWNVVTYQFDLVKREAPKLPTMSATLPVGLKFPKLNVVVCSIENDQYKWRRPVRVHGMLVNVMAEPAIVGDLSDQPIAAIRSVDADIALDNAPGKIVGKLHAQLADGKFSYRIVWSGENADIQELGWAFEMPGAFDHFSWKREAPWSYYPSTYIGRSEGTALPDSAKVNNTKLARPDAFDFNSTKYDCDWASLTDARGHGLRVEFTADQRHHCKGGFGQDGAYRLIVNRQVSPPRDYSSGQVPEMYMLLKADNSVQGSFYVGSQ